MKLRNLIVAGSIALLPVVASAASLYIPAAGTGPGANFSQWETEIVFHNPTAAPIAVTLIFHDQAGSAETAGVLVPARGTIALQDVVSSKFGRESATGAIEIMAPQNSTADRLVVTSRTKNVTPEGDFGQDIPALRASDAAQQGEVAVLPGPSSAVSARFNFGLFTLSETSVRWQLVRADGTIAATVERQYAAGIQRQYNYGVPTLFNATPADNDVVQATVLAGSAMFYGTAVNEQSGDPSFVPGIRIRADSGLRFAGIDINEDGTIDIADANDDGVLDAPLDTFIGLFPNFFRVVAESDAAGTLTYAVISSTTDAIVADSIGTIQMYPSVALRGTSGELKVRVTNADGLSRVLTIPVRFR
jgi:hypothetical protein